MLESSGVPFERSEDWRARFERFPRAVEAVYVTHEPNSPVILYKGQLVLEQGEYRVDVIGKIFLDWLPSPHIMFFAELKTPIPLALGDEKPVRVVSTDLEAVGWIINMKFSETATVMGILMDVNKGHQVEIANLVFHVPNFTQYFGVSVRSDLCTDKAQSWSGKVWQGRLTLEASGWRIIIDQLEGIDSEFYRQLKAVGGFGLTHVGKLERYDGSVFEIDERVENLLEGLGYFLSFVRGAWSFPVLWVGFSPSGEKVFERWSTPKLSPFRTCQSWFPKNRAVEIVTIWPRFVELWEDQNWSKQMAIAIDWFVEANSPHSIESGIVLSQVGLELLAWKLFADGSDVKLDQFDKLPAADKLRLLLDKAKIPQAIPSELEDLARAAKANNWRDGPQALTEIRNGIVHGQKLEKVLRLSIDVRRDIWVLGLWYLELTLLWLMRYSGLYVNRCASGKYELVPWAT